MLRLKCDCLAYLPQALKRTHSPLIEISYEFPKVSRTVLKLDKGYSAIRRGFQSLLRSMSVSSSLTCYNEKR